MYRKRLIPEPYGYIQVELGSLRNNDQMDEVQQTMIQCSGFVTFLHCNRSKILFLFEYLNAG